MNTEIFQKCSTTDCRNMQQHMFMQHSFLFVNILVPYRVVKHNDVLSHFILSSTVFLEHEIMQIAIARQGHFLCSLHNVEKMMDFLRLVYIVIPKLQTNQEMQKWSLNSLADGPESVAFLSPQHDCLVLLRIFSKRYTRRKFELSLIAFNKWRNWHWNWGSTIYCAENLFLYMD